MEDRLAYYLVKRLPRIQKIYINQPLSFASTHIKPDLVILRRGQVRLFIDLKMDLGYKREEFDRSLSRASRHVRAMRRKGSVHFWESDKSERGKTSLHSTGLTECAVSFRRGQGQ